MVGCRTAVRGIVQYDTVMAHRLAAVTARLLHCSNIERTSRPMQLAIHPPHPASSDLGGGGENLKLACDHAF